MAQRAELTALNERNAAADNASARGVNFGAKYYAPLILSAAEPSRPTHGPARSWLSRIAARIRGERSA